MTLRGQTRALIVPAVVGAAAVVAAACSSGTAAVDRSTLDWRSCGELECAVLDVPLDHGDPGGPRVGIDVARARAADTEARRGVLLVNPGGPGGSGTALARQLARTAPDLADVFDIVGWDPRGVGPSMELECDGPLVDFYRIDNTPETPDEQAALDGAAVAAADACAADAMALLPHIGTSAVVEDMDLLREALGEGQISYLGFSYGTMLGLVYADRHGEHLRAAVLDGILDPTFTLEEWLTSQAVATEEALASALADCGQCQPFGIDTFQALLRHADAGSLLADGTPVGPADVSRAGIVATYATSLHPQLIRAMDQALTGDGSGILELSNTFLNLASFDVYTAVSCLDNQRPPDPAGYEEMAARMATAAPILGEAIANELRPCAVWPVAPDPPLDELSADDTPVMLILGNTGDGATPYADAVSVADRLDRAVLVTFEGAGHTSYQEGSTCVDDAVHAYLRDLVLPPPNLTCR